MVYKEYMYLDYDMSKESKDGMAASRLRILL